MLQGLAKKKTSPITQKSINCAHHKYPKKPTESIFQGHGSTILCHSELQMIIHVVDTDDMYEVRLAGFAVLSGGAKQ